ncbi:MAG: M6 family metalloprotease domain-containing protein, partial [Methanobacteriaceae archaeon]|nr:M6 family metalloprotease domain-containing protein [Methanobacteriaceae archaeon]
VKAFERHLHPSIYKRIIKTNKLLQENLNPDKFRAEGGLDLDTYSALQERWQDQEERIQGIKQEYKAKYGSLKNIPSSIGRCRKIEMVGTKNALVLLIEFDDIKHTAIYDDNYFKDLLFSKGKQSMRDYFLEASWNQLDIKGEVSDGWYTAAHNRAEYLDKYPVKGSYPKAQNLVKEAIIQAKNSNKFDFTHFANDDGKIDMLLVVFAGSGFDTKLNINYIRPHQDKLIEPIEVQEGIWVDRYSMNPELPADDLGCFCHEMGHLLGLPDLYKEGYSPVVGSWCLMAVGCYNNNSRTPAHPSAWCKIHLGWTKPKLVEKNLQTYEIPEIIREKEIYKLEVEGSQGKEYFLLENRQQKGFDKYLPGSGLLIWHVDEGVCVPQAPNSDPNHFFLTLKQSDGKEDLQSDRTELFKNQMLEKLPKDIEGDLGDPFPGITLNRTFNDESHPNSRSYKGKKSFIEVFSISDSEDVMTAKMGIQKISHGNNIQFNFSDAAAEPKKETTKNFTPLQFIICNYPAQPKGPYQQGKEDYFEDIKKEIGLEDFQDGYRRGYLHGYQEAVKKAKK